MSKSKRKVEIDLWWLNWLTNKAIESPLKYDTTGVPFVQQGTLRTLQALEALLLEHGVDAQFEVNLARKNKAKP